MTANIRTSLEQKINKIIPNFSTSNLHTIASMRIFEGETKSRFSLFYEAIGISLEEQKRINNLATKPKKKEYIDLITKFVEGNSVDKFKSGDRKGENKMDNIGRQKLFDIMKLYIVKDPESFGGSETKSSEKEPEVKVQDNKQQPKLNTEYTPIMNISETIANTKGVATKVGRMLTKKSLVQPKLINENVFVNPSDNKASIDLLKFKELEARKQQKIDSMISTGSIDKTFGLTESKQASLSQTPNSVISIKNKNQPKLKVSEVINPIDDNRKKKAKMTEFVKQHNKKKQTTVPEVAEIKESGKEREVKVQQEEQPITTDQSTASSKILQTMSKLPIGGLLGLASSYAIRTNNKDLSRYISPLFAALGDVVYRSLSDNPYGIRDLLNKIKSYGVSEDDLINESKQPSAKKATRAVKFEESKGKPDGQPKPDESNNRPSPIDEKNEPTKLPVRQNPKISQTEAEMDKMINKALDKEIENKKLTEIIREVKQLENKNMFTRFTDKTLPYEKALATAILKRVNPTLYNRIFLSDEQLRNMESKRDAVFPTMDQMMKDFNELKNNEDAFVNDLTDSKVTLGDRNGDYLEPNVFSQFNYADYVDSEDVVPAGSVRDRFDRMSNIAKTVGGSVAATGAGLAVKMVTDKLGLTGDIKEEPIAYKQDKSDQNDVPTAPGLIRGAGILKPKFIVPSVNIFAKTEQEQFVDDMEFAMFDFVQDDSGGNDPDGNNPILRDQTLSKGLRYQRSGVTVNSLYGRDIPNDPKNISKELMNQLFLGEPVLPQMKFLFSEEFNPQEFNLSEFEVNNYDVNNELTAIEMLSPYANFTNNQLLDQFIDTSILYGIVP